jgi:hypothetical protein
LAFRLPAVTGTEHDGEDSDWQPGEEEEEYEDSRPPRRWRRLAAIVGVVALVGLGLGLGLTLTASSSGAQSGPEGVPVQQVPDLASANSTVSGTPVDGITCRKTMQQNVEYHIHVLVSIFVNGVQERLPAGAGIVPPRTYQQIPGGLFVDNSTSSCLYWLHVHANDGIIHVESPTKQTFTLGQFFDVWGQPLGPDQVGPARGPVVAFQDGKRFSGNPRDIPLISQSVVQLDVGTPIVPFKPMKFTVIGLCSLTCAPPPTS